MTKIKFNLKLTIKVLLFLACSAFAFLWPELGNDLQAQLYRPPNPVMDYVPQNVGTYDTYYVNFKEPDCRVCHGDRDAVAKRHQFTAGAFADCPDGCPLSPSDCLSACHSFYPGNPEDMTYDCRECHTEYGMMGDLGFPHHRSDLADSGLCTACHQPNLLVETRSVRPPSYYPTAYPFAPTPFNCENCHWPSGDAAHQPPPLADWNLWTGLPKPTTWPDSLPHPAPIEAAGPVMSFNSPPYSSLHPSKPYRPRDGTHHEVQGGVFYQCVFCHANDPGNPTWETIDPLIIRQCENCHGIDSLHGIVEHITAGHGLTVEQKCIACHGGLPDTSPVLVPAQPVITAISPRFGSVGTTCSLSGKNFGTSGEIFLTAKIGETGQIHRISSGECSWTNELIIFTVPSGLSNRNYNVKVKTPNGTSNMQVFTVAGTQPCIPCPTLAPIINSIAPTLGVEEQVVTVHGQNFGDRHTDNRDVMLIQTDSSPAKIISWADNEIQCRIPAWTVYPGIVHVKAQTENGESNQVDFDLRIYPHIEAMDQPDTTTLRLSGSGFGDSQQNVRLDGYGWQSTVTLNHPGINISPCSITSWGNTEIQLILPGNLSDFYGVTVETTYFYDSDGNGRYTSGLDTIYQTAAGDLYYAFLTTPIICGNGVVDPCETCDPPGTPGPNSLQPGTCRSTCTYCGDGIVNNGEACDDGNGVNDDGCKNDCTITPQTDLVVPSLTAPVSAGAGTNISITDTTKNNGPGTSPASTTNFYLSTDAILNQGDIIFGGRTVPALGTGISSSATTSITLPTNIPSGSYYIIAKADDPNLISETNEYNNTNTRFIKVLPCTLTKPNGGEVIPSGSSYTIQWLASSDAVKFDLQYSLNSGKAWTSIANQVTGSSYNWTVPAPTNNKTKCRVKVIAYNASGSKVGDDKSDSTFTIEVVKVTSPDGGEILKQGTIHTIRWTTNATANPVAKVKLFYSINSGTTWTLIATIIGNPGSYNWTVPKVSSGMCKVKVLLKNASGATMGTDISDSNFSIQP